MKLMIRYFLFTFIIINSNSLFAETQSFHDFEPKVLDQKLVCSVVHCTKPNETELLLRDGINCDKKIVYDSNYYSCGQIIDGRRMLNCHFHAFKLKNILRAYGFSEIGNRSFKTPWNSNCSSTAFRFSKENE